MVEEIRSKRFYLPELELIMVDEADDVIGYVMFSRFHLDGKYEIIAVIHLSVDALQTTGKSFTIKHSGVGRPTDSWAVIP